MLEWAEVLGGLSDNQIREGLEKLDGEWPPTAYGFRDLCRKAKNPHPSYRDFPKLAKPEINIEEGEEWIKKIKESLE